MSKLKMSNTFTVPSGGTYLFSTGSSINVNTKTDYYLEMIQYLVEHRNDLEVRKGLIDLGNLLDEVKKETKVKKELKEWLR